MITKIPRSRGRPRAFNPDDAIVTAQRLFRERGYDALSISELTDEIGIKPPSFYAAFGSKADLFARVLARYTEAEGVPLRQILKPGRPAPDAIKTVLLEAAKRYASGTGGAGCLAIEGARSNDPDARKAALSFTNGAREVIREFLAASNPEVAERLADYVVTVMSGLSTMARESHNADQLRSTALLASAALEQELGLSR